MSKAPTKKTTGLGAFAGAKTKPKPKATPKSKPAAKAKPAPALPIAAADVPRKYGPAKTYEQPRRGVTLRFTNEQHDALRQFAFEERTTIQDLALRGIAMMFEERGLPKPW